MNLNYSWFKSYPKDVNFEIDPDKYQSLADLFEETFKKFSNLAAFENFKTSISYQELDILSKRFAAFLQKDLGLKKGDRIAIQMPNLLQYPVCLIGALRAGLIVVNTNPLYTARELKHQLVDSEVSTIVILANFADNLEKIVRETSIKHVIVTQIGDLLGPVKRPLINLVVKHIKKMVPAYTLKGHFRFHDIMQKRHHEEYNKVVIQGSDLAFLQYTGGTTGISKGAMLTHRNLIANMEQISEWMKPKLKEAEEIIITALPLYHIFALTVNCLAFMKIGSKNILITNPRELNGFIKELGRHKFTVITAVNTLFNALLNNPRFSKLDFSSLKIAVGGGMAVKNVVAEKWIQVTKNDLAEGYGLTETSPVLTCNPINGQSRIGTIGLPLPSTEISIMNDEGLEVKDGELGEIYARGPQVMLGYWKNVVETENSFSNGWFKTGDIGFMDEDGYFRIVDRKKEMINVSGFNVYPNEIEEVVSKHPKVLEVGAVGIPDDRSNEVVKIFVVKKDQSLTEEELYKHCSEYLTAYKRPKKIEFRNELPKSNIGKILRRKLIEQEV